MVSVYETNQSVDVVVRTYAHPVSECPVSGEAASIGRVYEVGNFELVPLISAICVSGDVAVSRANQPLLGFGFTGKIEGVDVCILGESPARIKLGCLAAMLNFVAFRRTT